MTPPTELAETIGRIMLRHDVPGASVAVLNPEGASWQAGFGIRSAGSNGQVESDTLFQCASISKPVAAMVALALVQQNRLTLDEDLNNRLTSWRILVGPATRTQKVTLRRLLSHTAGISHHSVGSYMPGDVIPSAVQILRGDKPAQNSPVHVMTQPGTMWKYSGGGYVILQQLICDVTGQDFADAANTLLLGPVGMKDSFFAQPLPEVYFSRAASGHVEGKALPRGAPITPALAAGGLWTTAPDLLRFVQFLIQAAEGVQNAVLSQTLAREMLTLRHPKPYGLGLQLFHRPPVASAFGHGGNNRGFESYVLADIPSGRCAVVLANRNTSSRFLREVITEIRSTQDGLQVESSEPPAD